MIELFLDDKAIKNLTAETVAYAFQFGNHIFLYLLRKCKHLLENRSCQGTIECSGEDSTGQMSLTQVMNWWHNPCKETVWTK